jgi:hypothetical protein
LKDFYLLRPVSVLFVVMEAQYGTEVLRSQNNFVIMMAKPVIKHVGDRPYEGIEEQLKETDEWCEVVPYSHFVLSCCVGLWKDLSEDDYCNCRNDDG